MTRRRALRRNSRLAGRAEAAPTVSGRARRRSPPATPSLTTAPIVPSPVGFVSSIAPGDIHPWRIAGPIFVWWLLTVFTAFMFLRVSVGPLIEFTTVKAPTQVWVINYEILIFVSVFMLLVVGPGVVRWLMDSSGWRIDTADED